MKTVYVIRGSHVSQFYEENEKTDPTRVSETEYEDIMDAFDEVVANTERNISE